jgi:hypothetical protein
MTVKTRDFHYQGWELLDAIDALIAYDHGALDSGAFDSEMREAVVSYLKGLDDESLRRILAEYARRLLTPEAILAGYGLSDVCNFIEWLSESHIPVV